MKKLLALSLLALPLLAISARPAPAWTQFRLCTGLNFDFSTGGHCFHIGFCSAPCPCDGGCGDGWGGGLYDGYGGASLYGTTVASAPDAAYPSSGVLDANTPSQVAGSPSLWYGASAYQPVSYGYPQAASYGYGQ